MREVSDDYHLDEEDFQWMPGTGKKENCEGCPAELICLTKADAKMYVVFCSGCVDPLGIWNGLPLRDGSQELDLEEDDWAMAAMCDGFPHYQTEVRCKSCEWEEKMSKND